MRVCARAWARVRNLLQLYESSAVVAPFRRVLQVLADSVRQRSECWIQILHRQLGATQTEEEEEEIETWRLAQSPCVRRRLAATLALQSGLRSILAVLKQGLWGKNIVTYLR